jgi:hypothetical protein
MKKYVAGGFLLLPTFSAHKCMYTLWHDSKSAEIPFHFKRKL